MLVFLFAPFAAFASGVGSCPTPFRAIRAVRSDYPIVPNYRTILAAAHCTDLRCAAIDAQTHFAALDAIMFDRGRGPLSAAAVRFVLSMRPTPPTLAMAEKSIEWRAYREAFQTYLDDFTTNTSAVRTVYLDDDGGTERVRTVLEHLSRRPATLQDARSLAEISDRHPDEFAPLLYLGAVLLERGCKAQALHVYRTIPFVRPTVKVTYSGVATSAMRLALSIDSNAWRRSPADRPPTAAP